MLVEPSCVITLLLSLGVAYSNTNNHCKWCYHIICSRGALYLRGKAWQLHVEVVVRDKRCQVAILLASWAWHVAILDLPLTCRACIFIKDVAVNSLEEELSII